VTLYSIEVRSISEQYDVRAHRLVREILQLPIQLLPSLAAIVEPPLTIRTSHLYYLTGTISPSQLDQLTAQLLVDPVIQQAQDATNASSSHIVDVFFHPGVTDSLAESVQAGAHMLGITGLKSVETGQRYLLDERLSEANVRAIAQALLYNPVIQHYRLTPINFAEHAHPMADLPQEPVAIQASVVTTPLVHMDDEQLVETSRLGLLSLNIDEMRAIQGYYRQQGRNPTDVELETLAQTWSEHCSHKTFKATIEYREIARSGAVIEQETIQGLLKQYIMRATEQVNVPYLVSAFSDNAGIIRFTPEQDIAFKVETHNHPSAIEPFGGANTGVGGVIRDVLGVSAQPIACTDILCFGPLATASEGLPDGVLSPKRIADGVVNGVRDYGNKMGIPTVNGAVLYHRGYIYNPLVFCGCLGVLPHGSHPNRVQPGDMIVVLGGRTGRDGIHGATFSSGEMSSEINAQAGTAVQIGAPITEKKVADAIMLARDRRLYHAITDCGAGGFSSAIGEMGERTGAHVELDKAPLKYQGLAPWEIWLSEAQERMVLAVPPENIADLREICSIEEVELSILGAFSSDHRLVISYRGTIVADMEMEFLHHGMPGRTLEAFWTQPATNEALISQPPAAVDSYQEAISRSLAPTLLALLRHPSIASKEAVVRRYDHEVQGATVLKPLVGRTGQGPGDAAVLQPILEEHTQAGVILSNGVNPLYGKIDPYHMALNAVDEALRNLTAVGGDITHAALLDNFCWGNPRDPEQLGLLVRAVKGCYDASLGFAIPFISGKDSLNNEYRAHGQRFPVIPTLLISALGVIEDAAQTIDMSLKTPGNLLYMVGSTRNELAGSHYMEVIDQDSIAQFLPHTSVPQVDIAHAYSTMKALGEAIRMDMLRACHDLSEGGLAVAAAEMAIAGGLGATLDIAQIGRPAQAMQKSQESQEQPAQTEPSPQAPLVDVRPAAVNLVRLFSESPSRFLVEVAPERLGTFEKHMRTQGIEDITYIGTVTNTTDFIVQDGDKELMKLHLDELQDAWNGGQA
jgi:phosphoribosylformylglycinamidine synthase subunit PurSL